MSKPWLTTEDVAALFTEENRRTLGDNAASITAQTVRSYVTFSTPTKPGVKYKHRYENNPIPPMTYLSPDGKPGRGIKGMWMPGTRPDGTPETLEDVKDRLIEWWHSRSGPVRPAGRVRCWCGCGTFVERHNMCDEAIAELTRMKALAAFHEGGDVEEMAFIKELRGAEAPKGRRASWKTVAAALEKRRRDAQ